MSYIRLPAPGTLCTHEAIREAIASIRPATFVDVGCGRGEASGLLCSLGLTGTGIDFSPHSIEACRTSMAAPLASGVFRLVEGDISEIAEDAIPRADVAVSVMVMEHVEDDRSFVTRMKTMVKPGGLVLVCVPGRRDLWCIEDETVGHYRRYDREDLKRVLEQAGLSKVEVWSVAVPVSNVLFGLSNWLIRRAGEASKKTLDKVDQTKLVPIREVPWKTVYPSWVGLILNRVTLYPILLLQRAFYRSGLGTVMLGFGRV